MKLSISFLLVSISALGGVLASPNPNPNPQIRSTVSAEPPPTRTTAPSEPTPTTRASPPPITSTTRAEPPIATGPAPPAVIYTGKATWANFGIGSCGFTNSDDEYVVGVSQILMSKWPGASANPNKNPLCLHNITAKYQTKTVTAIIVDTCRGCAESAINLSPSAFKALANPDLGVLDGVIWTIS